MSRLSLVSAGHSPTCRHGLESAAKRSSVANLGSLMKGILPPEYLEFSLDYDGLSNRLILVKKEFGMRKAVSTRSLKGETRTFAEMLDQEVEKIVLFYLRKQGEIARTLWYTRERAFASLQGSPLSLADIDEACDTYRGLCQAVIELLEYLELNVIGLRKILKKHDAQFDSKMTHMYFDARLGGSARNSQLVQLYHQEGVRAIIGTICRAFEELHEARKVVLAESGRRQAYVIDSSERCDDDTGYAFDFSDGPATYYPSKSNSGSRKNGKYVLPRMPYAERRASYSSGSLMNLPSSGLHYGNGFSPTRTRSVGKNMNFTKTVTDIEPSLKRIIDVADRVLKQQEQTSTDYIATHSTMALEMRVRALNKSEDEEDEEMDESLGLKKPEKETSSVGLFLNLYITFLYQANQYVVAPTSGQYSDMLGMSSAMSGVIIGLGPAAALVSALLFSAWSNYGFKRPLVFSLICLTFGNFLYGSALQFKSPYMIFLGRLIAGFGGPRGLTRRYIADHVSLADRTVASSHFVTAGALGLAFGPLISSIVAQADYSFTWRVGGVKVVQYEEVTAPGWIMFVLFLTCLFATHFLFYDPVIDAVFEKPKSIFNFLFRAPKVLRRKGEKEYELMHSCDNQEPTYNVIVGVDGADFPTAAADMDVESQNAYEMSKMDHMRGLQALAPASSSPSADANPLTLYTTAYPNDMSPAISGYNDETGVKKHDGNDLKGGASKPVEDLMEASNGSSGLSHAEKSPRNSPRTSNLASKLMETSLQVGPKDSLDVKYGNEAARFSRSDEEGSSAKIRKDYKGYGSIDKCQTSRGGKSSQGSLLRKKSGDACNENDNYKHVGFNSFPANNREHLEYHMSHPALKLDKDTWCWDYMTMEVAIILFVYFINKVGQEMVVSSAPTLSRAMFSWSAKVNGFFMASMGASVLPGSVLVSNTARGVEDRTMMNVLNWCSFIVCLLMFDTTLFKYTIAQYVVGSTLLFAILNVLEGVIMSLLSKLVSPELARGTFNSGFLATEAGTLGRVVADGYITLIGVSFATASLINLLYLPVAIGVLVCIVIYCRFSESLSV